MNSETRKRILVVSDDYVDTNMGGVGIRNWELSHSLALYATVMLAIPNQTRLRSEAVELITYNREGQDLRSLAQSADAIVVQGFVLHFQPYLTEVGRPIAVDLYVPYLLESLAWHDQSHWTSWIPDYEEYLRVQLELLRFGDFFFCASERQRDYWLGWLHSQKRINPHTYHQSPDLRKLIDVVPFGLPREPFTADHAVLKGVHPGISPTDKLVIWSGGLWDWLDPLSLIRAVALLVPQHPEIKLYFMGSHHPNPVVSGMEMPGMALDLSRELGLLDRHVFFGDWTPYVERGNYLAEADLAVLAHPEHIETHFAFRTRVLDCIWVGLPMVTTRGDTLAELVEDHHIGLTVPPNKVPALAEAILNMIDAKSKLGANKAFDVLRAKLQWDEVAQPLLKFCLNPTQAVDKGLYLTDIERISKDKDEFLNQVILEKDAHLDQVILEKDAFLAQVVHDKDEFLEQVVHEKDAALEQVFQEKDALLFEKKHELAEQNALIQRQQQQIEKYQKSFPMRLYFSIKRLFQR